MFGVVNALNNPGASVTAQTSGDMRVVLFVNGTTEWRGSFAQFLLDNTLAPVEVKEIAHKLTRGEPHLFGGGAQPTFRLERETPPAVASNLVTLTLRLEDDEGSTFTAQGVSVLAALGKIDEQLVALFTSSLVEDEEFDMHAALAALTWNEPGTRIYRRRCFSTPENNFTLTAKGGAS